MFDAIPELERLIDFQDVAEIFDTAKNREAAARLRSWSVLADEPELALSSSRCSTAGERASWRTSTTMKTSGRWKASTRRPASSRASKLLIEERRRPLEATGSLM